MIIKIKKKDRKGMTLLEVIIAIAIMLIAMEGFYLLFIRTWENNHYTLELGQASMVASQGVNKMVEYIRGTRQADNGAYPIGSANDNDFVTYSDYDKDGETERLHFYKEDQSVLMGIRNPSSGMPKIYASGDEEIMTIAENIANSSAEAIFFYYNKDYPGDLANNPISTPANVSNIRLIKINFKISIDPDNALRSIEMQTFVEMRNLNDYDRIQ